MALDQKRYAVLHCAKRDLAMEDDDWRALLWRVAHVESSRDLDFFTFNEVMTELARLGWTTEFGRKNLGARVGMASPAQIRLIRDVWIELTDGTGSEADLRRWMEKRFKISSLMFLDGPSAQRVLGGLMSWRARKRRQAPDATPPPA